MNKAKKQSNIDGKNFLHSSFLLEQEVLSSKLKLSSTSITHNGIMGEVNEKHFLEFLRRYLPKRYAVDSAIVIDSQGRTSDQIDIVIFDHQYTPTLLDQQDHRYVCAEAVYTVIEVKPTINKEYLEYASNKAESVRKLNRTSVPIIHAGGEYPAKPLFAIISGIIAIDISWQQGFSSQSFNNCYESLNDEKRINFGLALSGDYFDDFRDNKLQISSSQNSLGYFLFRLLKKLQDLGTVPAINWDQYATVMTELIT